MEVHFFIFWVRELGGGGVGSLVQPIEGGKKKIEMEMWCGCEFQKLDEF
jgi:hypothetical protein